MSKPKFYLTTPIYYANSRPHVGSAYTTIVCDVIARYKRMCGYDVAYLTGTDEHGVNIERAAEKQGITPQQLVDKNEKIFRELWKLLGITNTEFIRTTEPRHARAVQNLVRRTLERDKVLEPSQRAIYKKKYEGRYCIYDNLYVSDTPEPADCQICGRPGELVSEENYFFRLSAYQEKLLELYKNSPHFVHPDFRFNEVKSFVESGLKDISISRKSIKWGIPWPDDPEHVFYVWYDALTSYMSGIGFESEDPQKRAEYERFWPADIHAMGKEIIRFHAVYWPAFLMAAGIELPKQIIAHGWLLFEQEKMSKSKGNVAYPEPIVKVLGNDALRYYLLRDVVFGQDGNFSRESLITRYNAELANGLGNLANRTLTMINDYLEGSFPPADQPSVTQPGSLLMEKAQVAIQQANAANEKFEFNRALEVTWALITEVDQYLSIQRPWAEAKKPGTKLLLAATLYASAETIRCICVLAHPVIPDATQKIWEQLGQAGKIEDVRIDQLKWGELKSGTKIGKPEGVFPRIDKKEALERIETMENEIRNPATAGKPGSTQPDASTTTTKTPAEGASTGTSAAGAAAIPAGAPGAGKPVGGAVPAASGAGAATAVGASGPSTALGTSAAGPATALAAPVKIGIEDFAKVELRVGVVKSAEKVAGADKLLKVMVDIGDEVRQVLAGIATSYAPEELVGRKVVVVTNLAPRKMRGVESNGMLLAASAAPDGKAVLCTFAEEIPAGAKVK